MVENELTIASVNGPTRVTEVSGATEEVSSPEFVVPIESDRELLMGKIKDLSGKGGALEQETGSICSGECNGDCICSCRCDD